MNDNGKPSYKLAFEDAVKFGFVIGMVSFRTALQQASTSILVA